jgi:exopolyphosphatase/guanosine-5'-triphosphate,3'-diphosphate pyrophosphatase
MYIAEFLRHERALDFLIKPLRIGKDTFSKGYISLENVKKSTEILNLFKLKLEEYGVTEYRALCTSGVREAGNKDFFLDYTLHNSGIKLEVLEPWEESYIKYVGAKNSVDNFEELEREGVVLANVASGNVNLHATLKNRVVFSGTLPYGSLRLRQMFKSISHMKRYRAIQEYVKIMINSVARAVESGTINHLIGAGSSINMMLSLFNLKDNRIHLNMLQDIYEKVRTLPLDEIIETTGLRREQSSVLVTTLITYIELMKLVKAKSFVFSRDTFPRTMALYYTGKIKDTHLSDRAKNTLMHIARHYNADTRHAVWVNCFARTIFKELSDLHSLENNMRFALETAVVLNDVGNYISDLDAAANAFNIIKAIQMPGIDADIFQTAACVVFEANRTPQSVPPGGYVEMMAKNPLTIRKLAAIHRLADSLDAARNRHIKRISISVSDTIVVTADTVREAYLETYAFNNLKRYFAETFGIGIELKTRICYE